MKFQFNSNKFRYCIVCKQSHTDFKNHNYTKSHRNKLKQLLDKQLQKIQDVHFFLSRLTPITEFKQSNHWCDFCDVEVNEANSDFARFATVRHLSSKGHHKRVQQFFRKYGVVDRNVDEFCLPFHRFEEYQKQIREYKIEQERKEKRELQEYENVQYLKSLGFKVDDSILDSNSVAQLISKPTQKLTAVPLPSTEEGNIFTGATPPWLLPSAEEEEEKKPFDPKAEILRLEMERKMKKLNPNRVGAEFARRKMLGKLEEEPQEDWLPNFSSSFHIGKRSEYKKMHK